MATPAGITRDEDSLESVLLFKLAEALPEESVRLVMRIKTANIRISHQNLIMKLIHSHRNLVYKEGN
ncbi:hypothetical protein AQ616_08675 [Oceanobacillus sp. E9]|uniref:Uncharacterized protein n=1 Tax=Oceanobacillus kimchii TaxID=746691 RepID=A0ABQ5TK35_9BACI|nr:hypothetical protein AQ616_08675 [Oceanobacillus sp. E9]GLO67223.1 hypothetical protein MACH08_30070 [Oceanobacillus kimchii]